LEATRLPGQQANEPPHVLAKMPSVVAVGLEQPAGQQAVRALFRRAAGQHQRSWPVDCVKGAPEAHCVPAGQQYEPDDEPTAWALGQQLLLPAESDDEVITLPDVGQQKGAPEPPPNGRDTRSEGQQLLFDVATAPTAEPGQQYFWPFTSDTWLLGQQLRLSAELPAALDATLTQVSEPDGALGQQ